MAEFMTGVAIFILAVTGIGLLRVLRSRLAVELMMVVQLLGTGGAAALLLLGAADREPALTDVALLLMLLAAFSCAAFSLDWAQAAPPPRDDGETHG
jgi:multicomponent Na+:H+ antiporter subunit F